MGAAGAGVTEFFGGPGIRMTYLISIFNFGVQVRAAVRFHAVVSFLPIALFVALVAALAFTV